jgi:hypothetical protein
MFNTLQANNWSQNRHTWKVDSAIKISVIAAMPRFNKMHLSFDFPDLIDKKYVADE